MSGNSYNIGQGIRNNNTSTATRDSFHTPTHSQAPNNSYDLNSQNLDLQQSSRRSKGGNHFRRRSRTISAVAAKRFLQQIVSSSPFAGPSENKLITPIPPRSVAPVRPGQLDLPTNTGLSSASTASSSSSSAQQQSQPQIQSPRRPRTNRYSTGTILMSQEQPPVYGGGISGIPSHANSALNTASPRSSSASLGRSSSPHGSSSRRGRSGSIGSHPFASEKPLASTSGGAVAVTISLAEPVLFLQGYDQNNQPGSPALLRGSLILRLAKSAKIKALSLTFKGRARTEWPEGIPPKKSDFFEESELMTHTWPFFNAQFPNAELGHGADSARILKDCDSRQSTTTTIGSAIGSLARSASPVGLSAASTSLAADKRLSLQLQQNKNHGANKGDKDCPTQTSSVAQKGYRVFQAGDYVYNFELPIEGILPESIVCDLGSVKYELEATVERAGAFRPNLVGKKDVILIRCPADTSLEQVEPIAISRNWEDQLHYDIVISGKSFPLGSTIPIAFKLTPLAKVRCHRIKIFVTENVEYFCRNKKVHRIEPTRKIQLFEKRADQPLNSTFPGSTVRFLSGGPMNESSDRSSSHTSSGMTPDSLLGDLTGDSVGPTEMELSVQLPGCRAKDKERIHFDTTYQHIQVHHWIKIVMRLSKVDPNDSSKRRHFEISIDSPFHILSCKCSQANISLPAYTDDRLNTSTLGGACACPPQLSRRNSPTGDSSNSSSQDPQTEIFVPPHLRNFEPRPIHLMRAPSFNPPAFEDDVPPPIITPPPKYETIVRDGEGLADYFARLADSLDGEESEEDRHGGGGTALVLPRTPGRLARSMDERRNWEPIGRAV